MNGHHEQEPTTNERTPTVTPRIYVASLSDYNAGRLHGEWINVDGDVYVTEVQEHINRILQTSRDPGAEEWAIHDYEGFGMVRLNEYQSLETVVRLARGIEQHGPAFAAWASHVGLDNPEALDRFEDAFLGSWDSARDYADALLEDIGLLPEMDKVTPDLLQAYVSVDVESFARDMEISGMITAIKDPAGPGVWIFDGTI